MFRVDSVTETFRKSEGRFGVRAFVPQGELRRCHSRECWLQGVSGFTLNVVTVDQGWRVSQQPLAAGATFH